MTERIYVHRYVCMCMCGGECLLNIDGKWWSSFLLAYWGLKKRPTCSHSQLHKLVCTAHSRVITVAMNGSSRSSWHPQNTQLLGGVCPDTALQKPNVRQTLACSVSKHLLWTRHCTRHYKTRILFSLYKKKKTSRTSPKDTDCPGNYFPVEI